MLRKVIAAIAVAAALGAWGVAGWLSLAKSAEPIATDVDDEGARAVRAELHNIKGGVLGDQPAVRGDKIVGQVVHARDEDFEYSPRELCLRMKLEHPEGNEKLDCSRKEYDSPHDWNDR